MSILIVVLPTHMNILFLMYVLVQYITVHKDIRNYMKAGHKIISSQTLRDISYVTNMQTACNKNNMQGCRIKVLWPIFTACGRSIKS